MPLIVHHLGISQSERVVFLCEELGIPYELKLYKRSPLLSPPELKALHPIGAAPVIQDTDAGVTIAESEACLEYINQVHGKNALGIQPGEKNYADYLYWYTFTNGTLQPAFGRIMTLSFSGVSNDDPGKKRYAAKVEQCLTHLDNRLAEVEWLAGDRFTAADIMLMFTLTTGRKFVPWNLAKYPNVLAWMRRVAGREAYVRAMKKSDPELDVEDALRAEAPEPQAALKGKI
ncbi:Hypothetical protein R9X50_00613900 [Acrodontium crateriforme]|uniref:Glutathione S-transferase n=1 Tax=Acrodontium crateriforme TaxID=150365 RepID=A0AAQ3M935_9PEZI|nr:Hypothetical protein R9X50_00613900 [Acrodontium crateriforme]